jgi:hypothetical protein
LQQFEVGKVTPQRPLGGTQLRWLGKAQEAAGFAMALKLLEAAQERRRSNRGGHRGDPGSQGARPAADVGPQAIAVSSNGV